MARAILNLAACCVLSAACSTHVPERVTTDGLLAIQEGMTYDEVETLIGPPLCIVSVEDARFSDTDRRVADALVHECGPFQWTTTSVPANLRQATELSLSYAEPRAAFVVDPNIYVHFAAGHVSSVYIKKDDYGICCMAGLSTSPFYWVGSKELLHELVGR